jgi:hypothetical protein
MIAPPKPPSHGELDALIKEARERQLRRRLLGAAGVAIATAAGLSVYAFVTGGNPGANGSRTPVAAAPPCRSSQLSASFTPGGAAGLALGGLVIGNIADRSCVLPVGRPIVHVIFRGRPLPTRERAWAPDQQFGRRAGHLLGPGTRAFFEIGWRGSCQNPAAAPVGHHATLSLRFRDGLRLAVPETAADRFVSLPGCGEAAHPLPWIAVSNLLRYR